MPALEDYQYTVKGETKHLAGGSENIIDFYVNDLTDYERMSGAQWYSKARDIAVTVGEGCEYLPDESRDSHDYAEIGAGIIAALSPGLEWDINITAAFQVARSAYTPYAPYGWTNIDKAKRIASGESPLLVLGGPKVLAFFNAILHPYFNSGMPVIDRHARAIWAGYTLDADTHKVWSSKGKVNIVANDYRDAAESVGVSVHTMQAATWIGWRNRRGISSD